MSDESQLATGLLAILLTVFAVLVQVLAALLDRSGPIRLRYWAEEASGRLLALFEEPLKFEVFRYLLSWLARMATVVLFLVLLRVEVRVLVLAVELIGNPRSLMKTGSGGKVLAVSNFLPSRAHA